jgi:hypothetical protein
VSAAAGSTALAVTTVRSICAKCRTALPEGSQFCLKCGQPVVTEEKTSEPTALSVASVPVKLVAVEPRSPARRKRKRPIATWLLLLALVGIISWVAVSDSTTAQELRDQVTGARAEAIVETPLSVKPKGIAYYKFTVPPGAISVTVTGQFNSTVTGKSASASSVDGDVEAYLMTEAAFAVWQTGYSTSTHYESGKVPQATINVDLPSGAGVYYLVFSNRFSERTDKNVTANVVVQYKTWLPEWILLLKQRLWNWLGLV